MNSITVPPATPSSPTESALLPIVAFDEMKFEYLIAYADSMLPDSLSHVSWNEQIDSEGEQCFGCEKQESLPDHLSHVYLHEHYSLRPPVASVKVLYDAQCAKLDFTILAQDVLGLGPTTVDFGQLSYTFKAREDVTILEFRAEIVKCIYQMRQRGVIH